MNDFQVKDSGARQEFESGMRRDTEDGKPNFLLALDGPMHERYAIHMTKGAKKYGEGNWQNANSRAEYDRFRRSAYRHLRQWLCGDRDEDHASAVIFNLNAAEFVRDKALTAGYCVETEAGDVWLEPIRPQAEPQVADCRTVEEPPSPVAVPPAEDPYDADARLRAAMLVGLAGGPEGVGFGPHEMLKESAAEGSTCPRPRAQSPGEMLREERDLLREREERFSRDVAARADLAAGEAAARARRTPRQPRLTRPRVTLESDMPTLAEQERRGLRRDDIDTCHGEPGYGG